MTDHEDSPSPFAVALIVLGAVGSAAVMAMLLLVWWLR